MRVRFGQMSDFAEAILRENPNLPVVRGDMPDTWIHGIGSMPIETQLARRNVTFPSPHSKPLHGLSDAAILAGMELEHSIVPV